jgi:hypothetical protein
MRIQSKRRKMEDKKVRGRREGDVGEKETKK